MLRLWRSAAFRQGFSEGVLSAGKWIATPVTMVFVLYIIFFQST